MTKLTNPALLLIALATMLTGPAGRIAHAQSAPTSTSNAPYIVEWVYRVKWGYQDEFWRIFKKYQIATLDKEKETGAVLKYEVFRPGLHTSEDQRWDYRVIIYYKNSSSPATAGALSKQLFPDRATLRREENRRWEITEVHWDLPIRQADPHETPEE